MFSSWKLFKMKCNTSFYRLQIIFYVQLLCNLWENRYDSLIEFDKSFLRFDVYGKFWHWWKWLNAEVCLVLIGSFGLRLWERSPHELKEHQNSPKEDIRTIVSLDLGNSRVTPDSEHSYISINWDRTYHLNLATHTVPTSESGHSKISNNWIRTIVHFHKLSQDTYNITLHESGHSYNFTV